MNRTDEATARRTEYQRQTNSKPRKTTAPYLTQKQQNSLEKKRREAEQPSLFQ